MSKIEILSLFVTIICLISFSLVFTLLFRHYYLSLIDGVSKGETDSDILETAINNKRPEVIKKKNRNKIIKEIVSYTSLGLVTIMFGFSLYARISDNVMLLNDTGYVVIASGSMERKNSSNDYLKLNNLDNQFATYDIIQIQKYGAQKEVELYDVVAFKNNQNITIVHRIIRVEKDSLGKDVYITRGDSNNVSDNGTHYDNYLTYDKIVGHYTDYRIPVIGSFVIFLQSNIGIITVIALIYSIFIFDRYKSKYIKSIENRLDELYKIINFDDSNENLEFNSESYEVLSYNNKRYIFKEGEYLKTEHLIKESDTKKEKEN